MIPDTWELVTRYGTYPGYPPPPSLDAPRPAEFSAGVQLIYLVLETWNGVAWEVRQHLLTLPPVRVALPFQAYTPGRHHLAIDRKPADDRLDQEWGAALHEIALRRNPYHETRG